MKTSQQTIQLFNKVLEISKTIEKPLNILMKK